MEIWVQDETRWDGEEDREFEPWGKGKKEWSGKTEWYSGSEEDGAIWDGEEDREFGGWGKRGKGWCKWGQRRKSYTPDNDGR